MGRRVLQYSEISIPNRPRSDIAALNNDAGPRVINGYMFDGLSSEEHRNEEDRSRI